MCVLSASATLTALWLISLGTECLILEDKVKDYVQQCVETNMNCRLTCGHGLIKTHRADALAAAYKHLFQEGNKHHFSPLDNESP